MMSGFHCYYAHGWADDWNLAYAEEVLVGDYCAWCRLLMLELFHKVGGLR